MQKERRSLVFFIGNMSHYGGTERVLTAIANGLAERGYHIAIVSLWGKRPAFFRLEETIRVYWLEEECHKYRVMKQLVWLRHILRREKADFLIDVDIILGFYSVFMKWSLPDLHWISWEHFNYYSYFRRNAFLRKIVRRIVGAFSEYLVVLTKEDVGNYRRNIRMQCGLTHIYNPIPYDRTVAKMQEYPVIFAAGNLTKVKGFDLLIRSWEMLEGKYRAWKVVIAGEGEERKKLKREIRRRGLKNIYLIGSVSNIEKYYRKAAFFVLSSRSEGFPMVLLEAMNFSLPVVSYRCKTGPGEVIADGKNGFLVNPGDVAGFAEKMEVLMRDRELRRRMGRCAGKSAERFKKEKILDEWEALLEDCR